MTQTSQNKHAKQTTNNTNTEQNQARSGRRTVRLEETGSLFCCGSNSFFPLISAALSFKFSPSSLSLHPLLARREIRVKQRARTALKNASPPVESSGFDWLTPVTTVDNRRRRRVYVYAPVWWRTTRFVVFRSPAISQPARRSLLVWRYKWTNEHYSAVVSSKLKLSVNLFCDINY